MRRNVVLAVGLVGLLGLSAYAREDVKQDGAKKECCKKEAASSAASAETGHCDRKDKDKMAGADRSRDRKCDHKKESADCCKREQHKAADKQ